MRSAVSYEICRGACPHRDGLALGCHADCFRLIEGPIQEYLEVMVYTFEPTPSQEHSRYRWLLNDLVSRWGREGRNLPGLSWKLRGLAPELRCGIAEHLLREYSTASLSVLPLNNDNHLLEFNTSTEVWARIVSIEGVTYIASLSNTQTSDKDQLLYTPIPWRAVDTIYMGENYLGIVQVVFANSEETRIISQSPGIWWRLIRVPSTDCVLKVQTDVSSCLDYHDM